MGALLTRKHLGDDGYTISPLIVGGWQLSSGHRQDAVDETALFADLERMVRAGWTTFDCADIYTGVEERFGRFQERFAPAFRADGIELQFHTKYVPDLDDLAALDRSAVERIIDRSLRRLRLERLDLVQFSWWDYAIPGYVEVAQWLAELQQAGKIRHVGATNFDTPRMREMLEAGVRLASNQVQYSVLDRRPEAALVGLAESHDVGLLCYGALAGGLLSERYLGAAPLAEPVANRSLTKYGLIVDEAGGWERYQELLRALGAVAQRRGCSISAVALRWVLERPRVAGAMVGTFHGGHLEDNQRALALALTTEDREQIASAIDDLDPLDGDVFGLERIPDGPHSRIMWKNLSRKQS